MAFVWGWIPFAVDRVHPPRRACPRSSTAPGSPSRCVRSRNHAVAMGRSRVAVRACAVCRTDLHVLDGELTGPSCRSSSATRSSGRSWSAARGVTSIAARRSGGRALARMDRRDLRFCRSGRENLCDAARFTGYTVDGGYAEQTVADARFCFPLPPGLDDVHEAPLLCAGLIGYRALRARRRRAHRIGFYGFGVRRAHRGAGGSSHRARALRVHPGRGRARPGLCPRARRGLGGRLGGEAAGAARRGDRLRVRRRAGGPRARGARPRRRAWSARAST